MTRRTNAIRSGLAAGLIAMLASCATITPTTSLTHGLLLDHVNVVDVRDGSISRDRAIVIDNGRIVRVVGAGSTGVSGAAKVVDGRGAFVISGLNDMHAHNLNTVSPETSFPAMLANGVTGFRQMAPVDPAVNFANLPANAPALLAELIEHGADP